MSCALPLNHALIGQSGISQWAHIVFRAYTCGDKECGFKHAYLRQCTSESKRRLRNSPVEKVRECDGRLVTEMQSGWHLQPNLPDGSKLAKYIIHLVGRDFERKIPDIETAVDFWGQSYLLQYACELQGRESQDGPPFQLYTWFVKACAHKSKGRSGKKESTSHIRCYVCLRPSRPLAREAPYKVFDDVD